MKTWLSNKNAVLSNSVGHHTFWGGSRQIGPDCLGPNVWEPLRTASDLLRTAWLTSWSSQILECWAQLVPACFDPNSAHFRGSTAIFISVRSDEARVDWKREWQVYWALTPSNHLLTFNRTSIYDGQHAELYQSNKSNVKQIYSCTRIVERVFESNLSLRYRNILNVNDISLGGCGVTVADSVWPLCQYLH